MYKTIDKMNSTQRGHLWSALASIFTTQAIQAVKQDIINKKFGDIDNPDRIVEAGAISSHNGEPTLDERNEIDEHERFNPGKLDAKEVFKDADTLGDTNIFGHGVLMPMLKQAEIFAGLREYCIDELSNYTSDAFMQPQSYRDRHEFLSKDDGTFIRQQSVEQAQRMQRLLKDGKITQSQVDEAAKAAAKRFAAPFREHGPEILATVKTLYTPETTGSADDTWLQRLPLRTQLQVLDRLVAQLQRRAKTKYQQSAGITPAPPGSDPAGLEAEGTILDMTAEAIMMDERVPFAKRNKAELAEEEVLWQAEMNRRMSNRLARAQGDNVDHNGDAALVAAAFAAAKAGAGTEAEQF